MHLKKSITQLHSYRQCERSWYCYLLEYNDNYSMTSGSFGDDYIDEINDSAIENTKRW